MKTAPDQGANAGSFPASCSMLLNQKIKEYTAAIFFRKDGRRLDLRFKCNRDFIEKINTYFLPKDYKKFAEKLPPSNRAGSEVGHSTFINNG